MAEQVHVVSSGRLAERAAGAGDVWQPSAAGDVWRPSAVGVDTGCGSALRYGHPGATASAAGPFA